MYIEASDHACPHLREQTRVETKPIFAPTAQECPFAAGRAAAEPLHVVQASAGIGGWWAFCSQADGAEARV